MEKLVPPKSGDGQLGEEQPKVDVQLYSAASEVLMEVMDPRHLQSLDEQSLRRLQQWALDKVRQG